MLRIYAFNNLDESIEVPKILEESFNEDSDLRDYTTRDFRELCSFSKNVKILEFVFNNKEKVIDCVYKIEKGMKRISRKTNLETFYIIDDIITIIENKIENFREQTFSFQFITDNLEYGFKVLKTKLDKKEYVKILTKEYLCAAKKIVGGKDEK